MPDTKRPTWIQWVTDPSTSCRWAVYERMPGGEWRLWGNTHYTQTEAIDAFEDGQGYPTDRREWRRCRRRGQVMCVRTYVGVSPRQQRFMEAPDA